MSDEAAGGLKLTSKNWAAQRPRVAVIALLTHLGETGQDKKRTLSEWDAAYAAFLAAPVKSR